MSNDFLDIHSIPPRQLVAILEQAHRLKAARRSHEALLHGRSLAMIFEKPSTRTRVSFEVGMQELGGHPVILQTTDLQLGRGETIADTARVLSRYVDVIMMRAMTHETLQELADYATVPVINGLSDLSHPCQIMADLMTVQEQRGELRGLRVVWSGDGNNVLNSWLSAAAAFDFSLHIACPTGFEPHSDYIRQAQDEGAELVFHDSLGEAAQAADVVITDTWVSMGHEHSQSRRERLTPYQVTEETMVLAKPQAIFLHCLPAHRGQEVTAGVIDGPASAVWDEAENRLHAQKAILCWCLGVL